MRESRSEVSNASGRRRRKGGGSVQPALDGGETGEWRNMTCTESGLVHCRITKMQCRFQQKSHIPVLVDYLPNQLKPSSMIAFGYGTSRSDLILYLEPLSIYHSSTNFPRTPIARANLKESTDSQQSSYLTSVLRTAYHQDKVHSSWLLQALSHRY